jgi:hypothetical protein
MMAETRVAATETIMTNKPKLFNKKSATLCSKPLSLGEIYYITANSNMLLSLETF